MTLDNIRDLLILNNREILNRIEDLRTTVDIVMGTNLISLQKNISDVSVLLGNAQEQIDLINDSSLVALVQRLDDIDETLSYIQNTTIKNLEQKDKDLADKINKNIQDIKDINDAAVALAQTVQGHLDDTVIHVTQNDKDLWNATLQDAKDYAKDLFDGVTSFTIKIVSVLPTGEDIESMVIYFVPNTSNDSTNYYDEYMYINNQWEIVGNTRIDLTPYVKTEDLNKILESYVKLTDLTTKLNDYVKSDDLATQLSDYVKTTDLDIKLNDYSKTSDIENTYQKKTDSHTHSNKSTLDKLSVNIDGVLLFDGEEIKGGGSDITVSEEENNAIQNKDDGIFVEDKTQEIEDLKNKVLDVGQYATGIENTEDTPVGHILSFMGTTAPPHYLICDGAEYNISDYEKLSDFFIEQYGKANEFGGDGVITFCVPNLNNATAFYVSNSNILSSSDDNDIINYIKCIKYEPTYYIAYTASFEELNGIKEENTLLRQQNVVLQKEKQLLEQEIQSLSSILDYINGTVI